MARRARLQEFLGQRYPDSKKLRAFVDDTFGLDAVNSIGWEEGVNDETSDLITWLEAHGRTSDLWPALRSAFPSFADDIAALEREWKPSALGRFAPSVLLRSRPLQIAIASALILGVAAVWLVWFMRASYTTVLVLDDAASDELVNGGTFGVEIDHQVYALTENGLSIGKGDAFPESVREAYRAQIGGSKFPASIRVRLTSSRASAIRVTFNSHPCPKQPQIIADADTLHVITLDDCDPRAVSAVAAERPKIGVRVEVIDSDAFRRLFEARLSPERLRNGVEGFLVEQLIAQFNNMGVFQFVPASSDIAAASTLVGRIETQWPRIGDGVVLRLKLGSEDEQPLTLFRANGCGTPPCSPPDVADPIWYAAAFAELVKQWPAGFLKSIVLTNTATYEAGGVVRIDEDIEKFGQTDGGPPKALFDIAYGDNRRRTFVMCQSNKTQPRKGAGHDALPSNAQCVNQPATSEPTGRNGRVTLFRVLR